MRSANEVTGNIRTGQRVSPCGPVIAGCVAILGTALACSDAALNRQIVEPDRSAPTLAHKEFGHTAVRGRILSADSLLSLPV